MPQLGYRKIFFWLFHYTLNSNYLCAYEISYEQQVLFQTNQKKCVMAHKRDVTQVCHDTLFMIGLKSFESFSRNKKIAFL